MIESIQSVLLAHLVLSETGAQSERRKRFDKGALSELAESIRTVGLLQPIVVRRPVNAANGMFEIVAGERRAIAAKAAGLSEITCSVRELTDQQVLEVQLIENLQREGLHELVEAEGYEQLMKLGLTVDDLVAKVGKSKAYVYGRLKLTALGKAARKAFNDNQISASIALLIARLPDDDSQETALKTIGDSRLNYGTPMTYREAAQYVHETFMLKLGGALFPTGDADLVPAAGPCSKCPKRTGNQPELFGDVKGADVCTDPGCFKAKTAAWNRQQVAKAKETGSPVITGAAARKIVSKYSSDLAGYVRPGDKCASDPKKRTYAELLGKSDIDVESALLQNPSTGKFSKVLAIADVAKALKPIGITLSQQRAQPRSDYQSYDLERKRQREIRIAVIAAVLRKAPAKLGRRELEVLAETLVNNAQYEDSALAEATGFDFRYTGREKRIEKLSDPELNRLVTACVIAEELDYIHDGAEFKKIVKGYGVDADAIKREVEASQKAKEPAKKK